MKASDKQRILLEVVERTMCKHAQHAEGTERILFDTLYQERRRLEKEPDSKRIVDDRRFYDRIQHEGPGANPSKQRQLLHAMVKRFAEEVVGHFDPRVYALATRAVPPALGVLLNTLSPLRLLRGLPGGFPDFDQQLQIVGETDTLRALAKRGTTILAPTHVSNLDSILVGYALYKLGLPPYIYGAGLNLFSSKLMGFFMHNLGAYHVDRRKNATLYKDVLKAYAGCTMEAGYHNLFFPGGTRSRSGKIEKKLKLGLLSMGLDAYIHNLRAKVPRPDIFVVPCTVNCQLVLEAETLIADHLKETGKSRYIIEDDEFSQPRVVLDFVQKLFSLDSRIHLVLSRPLDVFGNPVDAEGNSLDARGRPIDRRRYVIRDGEVVFDSQRDAELTYELARSVMEAYRRDSVVGTVNLVSRAVFQLLCKHNPDLDIYRLLRTGGQEESLPMAEVHASVERRLQSLRQRADLGKTRLDSALLQADSMQVVGDALAHFASFHQKPAIERVGDRLFHRDRNLLLYYQNRLEGLDGDGSAA